MEFTKKQTLFFVLFRGDYYKIRLFLTIHVVLLLPAESDFFFFSRRIKISARSESGPKTMNEIQLPGSAVLHLKSH